MAESEAFKAFCSPASLEAGFVSIGVAGIRVRIYGLPPEHNACVAQQENMPPRQCKAIVCLHGRKGIEIHGAAANHPESVNSVDTMCRAISSITAANLTRVLAVSFDLRNHGSRLADPQLNDGYGGAEFPNIDHAFDMYSIIHSTAQDVICLLDFLPMKLLTRYNVVVEEWGVSGLSLGAHTSLMAAFLDARLNMIISLLGCADYECLLLQRIERARALNLQLSQTPLSSMWPTELQKLIERYDPVNRITTVLADRRAVGGGLPRFLFIVGGRDKIVPPKCSSKFLTMMNGIYIHDSKSWKVYTDPEEGHHCSPAMAKTTIDWITQAWGKNVK